MRVNLVILLLLLPLSSTLAQRATIDDMDVDVVCYGPTQAVCHRRLVITIHSEKGADEAGFMCSLGKTDQLKEFSGTASDASGRILRKFKKSDLERSGFSSHLAVDAYIQSLSYVPPIYPVTVSYDWTIQYNNDLLEFPGFIPQTAYDIDVRQARYRLTLPSSFKYLKALQNIDESLLQTSTDGKSEIVELCLKDLPAIERVEFGLPVQERVPFARFMPLQFSFFGTEGSLQSWQSYGSWVYGLLKDRDKLPENIVRHVHKLVEGCTSDRERVERCYQYLAQTTRYVSIQLGIGGHQPALATEVARTGYGDCKGLSMYMHALLKEVGINSYYTEIGTDYPHQLPDFPSIGMLNHVILQVPLPGDTLWIECTNPQLPLGYVHGGIIGHDAVLITPDGGRLCRLPVYPDSLNTQLSSLDIEVHDDGSANVQLRQESRQRQFESLWPLLELSAEEQKRATSQLFRFPNVSFTQLNMTTSGNTFLIDAKALSQGYASVTGKRLIVPMCPLHHTPNVSPADARKEPVYIEVGYEDADTITFHLPEGYAIESVPAGVSLQQPFGEFVQQIRQDGGQFLVINRLLIHAGTYPPQIYPAFADFMKKVSTAYTAKAILVKQ